MTHLRFFDQLDNSIDVRHSDELDSLGFVQDQPVIQYLNIGDNPVGRGKEDAALIIESGPFRKPTSISSTLFGKALSSATALARFTENQINDPLRLTIGEGSFLKNVSVALGFDDNCPRKTLRLTQGFLWLLDTKSTKVRMRLRKESSPT